MAIRGLGFEDKPMWVRLPRLPPKQRPQVNLAAFVILYRDIGAENMDVVMTIVRCAPISFQLAGALVVICVLSLSGSIDDVLNHTKVIATIPNEDPSQTTLTGWEVFCFAMLDFCKRGRLENT